MTDFKKARRQRTGMNRGPLSDARPDDTKDDTHANPSLPQEEVEDRENVSIVSPDDYPLADREISRPK